MKESISLLELNGRVKDSLKEAFPYPVWVHAEINELRENANGHCYLELIEKEEDGDSIVAKQKATIWSNVYRMVKPYFESTTHATLQAGLKISVLCRVEYHELYGMNLTISDIDPNYTLGDMAMRKQLIIERLMNDGVWEMNKELLLPLVPQRIAVISSSTAAGWGDFCSQIENNRYGYRFDVKLFPATMQGVGVEKSVISALDAINEESGMWDLVVIIRGGGATSDLTGFDTYDLGAHIAQFPLPIISGIGHQRDNTIPDMIAHTRVNTPTAAADFLIEQVHLFENEIDDVAGQLFADASEVLNEEKYQLESNVNRLLSVARLFVVKEERVLEEKGMRLRYALRVGLKEEKNFMDSAAKQLEMNDPQRLLKRGYSLVKKNGRVLSSQEGVQVGDEVSIVMSDGEVLTKIIDKK